MKKGSFNKILNKTAAQNMQRLKKEACCQLPSEEEIDALKCLCKNQSIPYRKKDGTTGNACDELAKAGSYFGGCIESLWDCDAPCCYARSALRNVILRSQGRWKNFCKVVVV